MSIERGYGEPMIKETLSFIPLIAKGCIIGKMMAYSNGQTSPPPSVTPSRTIPTSRVSCTSGGFARLLLPGYSHQDDTTMTRQNATTRTTPPPRRPGRPRALLTPYSST